MDSEEGERATMDIEEGEVAVQRERRAKTLKRAK